MPIDGLSAFFLAMVIPLGRSKLLQLYLAKGRNAVVEELNRKRYLTDSLILFTAAITEPIYTVSSGYLMQLHTAIRAGRWSELALALSSLWLLPSCLAPVTLALVCQYSTRSGDFYDSKVKDLTSIASLDKSFSLSHIISNTNVFYGIAFKFCDIFPLERVRNSKLPK